MSAIGNILWIIMGGFITSLGWAIAGLILCITIIGIPFGVQCFKIASLVLAPFRRTVESGNMGVGGFLGNILWLIFFGWELALGHLISALICFITIIGIPFGIQHLKLSKLAFIPFGANIR